jgi:hypothetical protein
MKVTRFLLSAVLLIGFAAPSFAQVTPIPELGGNMQLSWDNCAPLLQSKNAVAGPNVLYASVLGHTIPHQGYQVWLLIGDDAKSLPDAWRFDSNGCNAGFENATQTPPVALAKSCPSFGPTSGQFPVSVYQFAPPGLGYATTLGNAFLATAYPAGSQNIAPATRYHLAGFTFDHTFSTPGPTPADLSTCGGFEHGMCIVAIPNKCSWLDLAGNEFAFGNVNAGQSWVVYNGGTAGGGLCPGIIPAKAKTWGEIKDQYKR